jgi:hypothetical protein
MELADVTAAWATCRWGDVTRSSSPRPLARAFVVEAPRSVEAAAVSGQRGRGGRGARMHGASERRGGEEAQWREYFS